MAVSLVLFAIVLFMYSLYIATGTAPVSLPGKKVPDAGSDRPKTEQQRLIVVKLPETCLIPEEYTLDLKVSLHRSKEVGVKPDRSGRWYGNQYHRLDEYM